MYIQQGNRAGYTFKDEWFLQDGPLFGDNLFCKLYDNGNSEKIKLPSGRADDPDYLLLIWMYAQNEKWESLVLPTEVIFLYRYFKENGFTFMLGGLKKREEQLNDIQYGYVIKYLKDWWNAWV